MNVAICDNDLIFASKLEECILEFSWRCNIKINVGIFATGYETIRDMEESGFYDIIFVDYHSFNTLDKSWYMEHVKYKHGTIIVGILHKKEPLDRILSIHPFDCLTLPLNVNYLYNILEQIEMKWNRNEIYFRFKYNKEYYRLLYVNIIYFYSQRERAFVVTKEQEFLFYGKLSDVQKELPGYYIQIHKSFIINTKHIEKYSYDAITMDNGSILNVSRGNRKRVHEFVLKLFV